MSSLKPNPNPNRALLWSLLIGNLLIGTGVMLVPGMLTLMAADLGVSIPHAGLLLSVAAVGMGIGAPTLAIYTSRIDRRLLLASSLGLYAGGHALCALMPNFAALMPMRLLAVLGAAVFTPQAAATLSLLLPAEKRAGGITFIFLGWSLASVAGLPLGAYLGATVGWRMTFLLFAALCAAVAVLVWWAVPSGLKGTPLSRQAWVDVARHPALVGILAVTFTSACGMFSVWSYIAPYMQLLFAPSKELFSGMLVWFGAWGLIGNVIASRSIGRRGAPFNVHVSLVAMACGLALLMLVGKSVAGFALCSFLWGLGVFATNSSQQARVGAAAPALAGASLALNTSMMYLGQAVGASVGGAVIATAGYDLLPLIAVTLLCVALALSMRAARATTLATAPL